MSWFALRRGALAGACAALAAALLAGCAGPRVYETRDDHDHTVPEAAADIGTAAQDAARRPTAKPTPRS